MDEFDLTHKLMAEIRSGGIVDPNVDLFFGVFENNTEAVKDALERHADVNRIDIEVIEAHSNILEKRCPDLLKQFRAQRTTINKASQKPREQPIVVKVQHPNKKITAKGIIIGGLIIIAGAALTWGVNRTLDTVAPKSNAPLSNQTLAPEPKPSKSSKGTP